MRKVTGRRVAVSLPRRWITDLMRISHGVPLITFERRMNLAKLAEARKHRKVSWAILFTKAYGVLSHRRPELRRAYMSFPWARFFESNDSVGTLAVEREYEGEKAVFFAAIHNPIHQTLPQLQEHLLRWKTAPLKELPRYRRLILYSKLPGLVRRALWWYAFNIFGRVRAFNFGTFGVSVTASSGATALRLISPVATTISYGMLDEHGNLDVRLHFDHRVIDGMTASRVLVDLEAVLNDEMAAELLATEREP